MCLAVGDAGLVDWTDQPGTVLLAIDTATGDVIGRSEARALVGPWLSWGRSLVASTYVYKDIGGHDHLWIDGRERRQAFESNVVWTVHDSRRDRVIGMHSTYSDGTVLMTADAGTLDVVTVGGVTVAGLPPAYDATAGDVLAGDCGREHTWIKRPRVGGGGPRRSWRHGVPVVAGGDRSLRGHRPPA